MDSEQSYYERVNSLLERTRAALPSPHHAALKVESGPGGHRAAFNLLVVCALLAIIYTFDYAIVRARLATSRNALGSVKVERLYAIPQKGGKTEFSYGGTEVESCVHSLFPHLGYAPCWYAVRHTEKRNDY
jgi:hypothetical protein